MRVGPRNPLSPTPLSCTHSRRERSHRVHCPLHGSHGSSPWDRALTVGRKHDRRAGIVFARLAIAASRFASARNLRLNCTFGGSIAICGGGTEAQIRCIRHFFCTARGIVIIQAVGTYAEQLQTISYRACNLRTRRPWSRCPSTCPIRGGSRRSRPGPWANSCPQRSPSATHGSASRCLCSRC